MRITNEKLKSILAKHEKWLKGKDGGERADLQRADLQQANLQHANLQLAELQWADLQRADLQRADLRGAELQWADLQRADLRGAELQWANLQWADLQLAELQWANLQWADLRGANLQEANLSQVKGLIKATDWLKENFDYSDEGLLVYKAFGNRTPYFTHIPASWKLESGELIEENCASERSIACGCGVNFSTIDWIKHNIEKPHVIWKCLIEWKDLPGIVVPYNTDGKARCERLKLIEVIESEE